MNTLECKIAKILSKPIHKEEAGHEWWEVEIEYNSYGRLNKGKEVFNSKEEAEKLKVGDKVWK